MYTKFTREECIRLLKDKHSALLAENISRYPQRSDFEESEVAAIKAFLGPWPRALEAAGIKPPRDDGYAEAKLKKRIAAKRRLTAAKKSKNAD